MKKLLSIILAILLVVTIIPFAFAAEGTRTVYLIVPSGYVDENSPFTVYLNTQEGIVAWDEDTYCEEITLETDYQGNTPTPYGPAIYKVSFSDEYTHLVYSGGYCQSAELCLTEADVYAAVGFDLTMALDIDAAELSEISVIEAENSAVTVGEGEKAIILSSDYYGVPYGSVNNGVVLAAYTSNRFVNNGTILDGQYAYTDNYGTINGGTFTYTVNNYGAINGGDFSNEGTVIVDFGGTVSDSVRENALVLSEQSVTLNLTNLTHDAETLTTTPGEYFLFNIYANEGYAVPESITITVSGVETDRYSYDVAESSKEALINVWDTTQTGPITIIAEAEKATFAQVEALQLGSAEIVKNSLVKETSGEGWSYDAESNTLTLDNLTLVTSAEDEKGLYCYGDLNLIVKGENLIDNTASTETDCAVEILGDLKVSGTSTDSLTVKGSSCSGCDKRAVFLEGALEISGCKITSYAGSGVYSFGVYADELIVKDNAEIKGVSDESTNRYNYGISAFTITLESGKIIGVASDKTDTGVGVDGYVITLNDGYFEAQGNYADVTAYSEFNYTSDVTIKLSRSGIGEIEERKLEWNEDTQKFSCVEHIPEGELTCIGYFCQKCKEWYGEGDGVSHFGGYATCSEKKICSGCYQSYGDFDETNHNWIDGICYDCKAVCSHADEDLSDFCDMCYEFVGETVVPGDTHIITRTKVLKFAPEKSGTYIISAATESDAGLDLYDGIMLHLASAGKKNTTNLIFEYNYTGGEVYYIELSHNSVDDPYTVNFDCKTHQGGTATCTEQAVCEVCNKKYGEALGHDIIIDEAVAPKCGETGLTAGQHCSRCDAMTVIQEVVPATNHKDTIVQVDAKAPTCTDIGWDAYEYCTACDYTTYVEKEALDHDIIIDEAVAPKCGETGLTAGQHCSRCDAMTVIQEVVPALTHKDDNGDYKCDYGCGYEFEKPADPTPDEPTDGECGHLCHDTGFLGVIWLIVRFFIKMFKINPVCECGLAHY